MTQVENRARKAGQSFAPPLSSLARASLFGDFAPTESTAKLLLPGDIADAISAGIPELSLPWMKAFGASTNETAYVRAAASARLALEMSATRATAQIVGILTDRNCRAILIKGPTLARHDSRLADRVFTDVDILVAPRAIPSTVSVLEEAGWKYHRESWEFRKRRRSFAWHALKMTSPDGVALDIHHTVPPSFWGRRLTSEVLFSAGTPFEAGSTVFMPSLEHVTLISALQVIHDAGRGWRTWRDLAFLIRQESNRWAMESVSLGMSTPLFVVAAAVGFLLGCADLASRIPAESLVRADVRRLERLVEARDGVSHGHLLGMRRSEQLRLAMDYVWPDHDHLVATSERRGRVWTRIEWLGRVATRACRRFI